MECSLLLFTFFLFFCGCLFLIFLCYSSKWIKMANKKTLEKMMFKNDEILHQNNAMIDT